MKLDGAIHVTQNFSVSPFIHFFPWQTLTYVLFDAMKQFPSQNYHILEEILVCDTNLSECNRVFPIMTDL